MANTLTMEYKPFYQRLKVLFGGDYADSDISFSLVSVTAANQACRLLSGKIYNKFYELPLVYTSRSRLLIPYERKLYDDKALVEVTTEGACELSIAIQLKRPQQAYDSEDLVAQLEQLYRFMGDLAGMSKFILPTLKGATLHFTDAKSKVELVEWNGSNVTALVASADHKVRLTLAQIAAVDELRFNQLPLTISLWLDAE